jgi:ABC-type Fe3+/spermidine/putrescine transport system ATPase subunit
MVTHDQHEAMELADRIVVMNRGAIEQVGPPRELYDRPANRFVADFLGRMNPWPDRDGRPVLGVRPEHVELVAGADVGDGAEGTIRGTIERVVFLGSVTRVVVRAGERPCVVELKGSRLDLAAGQPVALRAPGDALLRLEAPAA